MQFTENVNWTLLDFIVAGVLLLGTGLICELILRKVKTIKFQIATCVTLLILIQMCTEKTNHIYAIFLISSIFTIVYLYSSPNPIL